MRTVNRRWNIVGTTFAAAMLLSCEGMEDPPNTEDVEVVMDPLQLIGPVNDPLFPGGPVTVCTVGGVTMHCCPNFQPGVPHYVMVGLNLAQNKFRCARLPNEFINTLAITLAPVNTTKLKDGITFSPACPGGAMVGLHWDLKRVACTRVSAQGNQLIEQVDLTPPDSTGTKFCSPVSNQPFYNGGAMVGMGSSIRTPSCA